MAKRISPEIIKRLKTLRQQGWSLPEIKKETNLGHGTVYRYLKDVEILPEFRAHWFSKRGGSIKRKKQAIELAKNKAKKNISSLSNKEKMIFIAALYWGEGTKSEFGLSNTDPELIKIIVKGLTEVFNIPQEDFRVSVRIYEDLDKKKCLKFWSDITGIPVKDFVNVNILQGKKQGKLPYGMCRVRVRKSANLLKYIIAIKNEVINYF